MSSHGESLSAQRAGSSMSSLLRLNTELAQPSPLFFGYDIAAQFSNTLDAMLDGEPADKLFLVADKGVYSAHAFGRALCEARRDVELVLVDPGESSKSWDGLEALCEYMVAHRASKRSVAIAFGGGSIGNLVGMAAALLFRGIRYVEAPTSFMHLTDGVLSNKQAINGRSGKNHFGIYHAPLFIWADVRHLETEPARSMKAGIAEAVKNALISSPALATSLRARLRSDCRYAAAELRELALSAILAKLEILRRDPSEKRYALVLEYGHTFAHAIEWLAQGTLLHGECVAVGMKMAAHLANELGLIADSVVDLHYELIDGCLDLAPELPPSIDAAALLAAMKRDNKRTGANLRFVLLDGLGSCANPEGDWLVTVADDAYLADFAARFLGTYPWRPQKRVRTPAQATAARTTVRLPQPALA
jgi:3-dehydroquinate synthase